MTKDTTVVLLSLSAYELLDYLDSLIPPRCIRPGETLEAAHRYAGARALIDDLLTMRAAELADRA